MPNYFSDEVLFEAPSGDLVVKQTRKGCYNVVHVGTGLVVPTRGLTQPDGSNPADIGTYRETWKYKGEVRSTYSDGWKTKTQAKKYMLALDADGLLHDYPDDNAERKLVLYKLIEFMKRYGS